ncbi:hypothetical protein R3P38DRAFT_242776 [Favolaschia claudopus]|uniref:Uncharacterized protein n=1 Tax=Favolaschia claudopus TaxID=2862362 RepID=A0AAW0CW69_9AGAR
MIVLSPVPSLAVGMGGNLLPSSLGLLHPEFCCLILPRYLRVKCLPHHGILLEYIALRGKSRPKIVVLSAPSTSLPSPAVRTETSLEETIDGVRRMGRGCAARGGHRRASAGCTPTLRMLPDTVLSRQADLRTHCITDAHFDKHKHLSDALCILTELGLQQTTSFASSQRVASEYARTQGSYGPFFDERIFNSQELKGGFSCRDSALSSANGGLPRRQPFDSPLIAPPPSSEFRCVVTGYSLPRVTCLPHRSSTHEDLGGAMREPRRLFLITTSSIECISLSSRPMVRTSQAFPSQPTSFVTAPARTFGYADASTVTAGGSEYTTDPLARLSSCRVSFPLSPTWIGVWARAWSKGDEERGRGHGDEEGEEEGEERATRMDASGRDVHDGDGETNTITSICPDGAADLSIL